MLPEVIVVPSGGGPSALEQALQVMGIVGPFLGVYFGARWTRMSGDDSWRRDRRLDVYTRISAALARIEDGSSQATSHSTHAGREAETAKLTEVLGELTRLRSEVGLLGPEDLANMADDAFIASSAFLSAIIDACQSAPEGEAAPNPPDDVRDRALWEHIRFVRMANDALAERGRLGSTLRRRQGARRDRRQAGTGATKRSPGSLPTS